MENRSGLCVAVAVGGFDGHAEPTTVGRDHRHHGEMPLEHPFLSGLLVNRGTRWGSRCLSTDCLEQCRIEIQRRETTTHLIDQKNRFRTQ